MCTAGKSRKKVWHVALVAGLLFAIGTATPTVFAANPVAAALPCMTSSASWVNAALPQPQTGAFRIEFDATPSSTGIDGVIGLSSGSASNYSNLAAIVRFNATGTIDARNGAAYTAATPIPYLAGTTYHFILEVNVAAHTYNASVVVNGAPVVVGSQLAFRSEQDGVTSLNNIASIASAGSQTICNVAVNLTSGCMVSSGGWANSALPQPETGAFRVEFDATPSSTGIDGVIGLSSGPASNYSNLAAIVRFNATGTIDARNGAAYTAATPIPYSAGTAYHFILDVNLATHTYNASVVVNGAPVVIGTKFTLRSEQAGVTSLNNIASMASAGSQTICNVTVSAVPVAPSITTQPVSQTVTSGQTATFSVAGTGTPPLSYQWQKNGSAISGATSSTYQTPVTTTSDNGSQFTVAMSNATGKATSSGVTLTVNAPAVAPSITAQPVSQTVTSGQTATFSVAGIGTAPMSYQWQKNGVVIGGATSSTYQSPVTAVSDSGSQFAVVMSNSAGSVISSGATLTVNAPAVAPSITAQPVSQTVTSGQTATFSVAGIGTAPMSYQWQKNGVVIGSATSSTYQSPVTAVSDSGSQFAVVMSNSAGKVTSSPATLTVIAPGCVTSSASWVNSPLPQAQTGTFRLEFDVTPASTGIDGVIGISSGPASDYPNLAAIVRFNATGTIDARNGAAYTAATAITYSAGTAYHFILDVNLATHTYNASVVVNGAPVVIGSQLAFRSEQAGVSSVSNIGAIATLGSQLICNVTISSVPPSITTQPVSQTVTPGQTATFSVAASGTAPMSYQWQKNGTAISGATSSSYQTPAATLSDNGSQFTVVISNAAGPVTSSSGTLAVTSETLLLGASSTQLSFGSVDVSSNGVQSVTITNAGNSNVTISNVTVSGAGFNAGGGAAGLILSPGQAAPLSVTFAPAAVGSASGSVTVTSNATNSPITIALTGTGAAQAHSVDLNWTASTSSVIGYNVYSSRVSGGPYVKLNPTPMSATSYTDKTVQSGLIYYYVTTAVGSGSSASESGFSAEASAVVP